MPWFVSASSCCRRTGCCNGSSAQWAVHMYDNRSKHGAVHCTHTHTLSLSHTHVYTYIMDKLNTRVQLAQLTPPSLLVGARGDALFLQHSRPAIPDACIYYYTEIERKPCSSLFFSPGLSSQNLSLESHAPTARMLQLLACSNCSHACCNPFP